MTKTKQPISIGQIWQDKRSVAGRESAEAVK